MGAAATTWQSRLILDEVMAFLERTGIPESNFGMLTVNDPRLTHQLYKGREPSDETVSKVRLFIQNYDERLGG